MALFLILSIILESALASNLPGSRYSAEQMLKKFSQLEQKYSVALNSSNLQSALTNNSDPWFIFFAEPRSMESNLKNAVWTVFSGRVKKKNLPINTGYVNLQQETDLMKKFKVFTFPAFIYLEEGFAYNFTGMAEPDDLEIVIQDKLYLQYDRMKFELNQDQTSHLSTFRKEFIKNPALFILAIFLTSTLGLSSFSFLCCRGKKNDDSKTKEQYKKSKKRE